ncbi:hypothetical protein BSF_01500 [Bacillus subtilis]|uniref:hypothetical protein n=1 Tax=Bacillus TaxID=1386 RepID=UPI000AEA696A|nr:MULTISPECIES: hypothetical protein [Bacillus]QQF64024.1 hypothetical protein I9X38_07060 [Bacillus mojavensis]BDG78421.1 hypothetical protein BSF_01500 [Bacillus subtilis]MBL4963465.1 hypothetical protein [Bacillus halotolerans]MBL4967043.1 hypothetical protein [Bacillus halotolerans]MBL4971112.1 hypothetical protein [Bacillus halotolerans]
MKHLKGDTFWAGSREKLKLFGTLWERPAFKDGRFIKQKTDACLIASALILKRK